MKNNCFKPGQVWLDTNGVPIQAHGGSVLFINGTYYWYGENKEKTVGDGKYWTYGIKCYSSTDLYNWQDLGFIIPPSEDEKSPLYPKNMIDRPHIVYNEKTKKFVCWIKIMYLEGIQAVTILTADKITGPYTVIKEKFRPLNMDAGDFDLVIAPDKKGYYYFEKVHTELICATLTDDYTDVTGEYTSHFPLEGPPFVREAPAYFTKGGKHYLITSGTTGYYPNPSEIAVASHYHGPFTVLGNPHVGDETDTSFHSQISSVFKVHGKKNLYIACGDRWLPNLMHVPYKAVRDMFKGWFTGEMEKGEQIVKEYNLPKYEATCSATYVWLPIVFENDKPKIYWHNSWKIEDFE